MEIPRFFVSLNSKIEDKINIQKEENMHLFSVLRLRVGDRIDVCLNDDNIYHCELVEVSKKQSVAKIINIEKTPPKNASIVLFMALIKAERMDWAMQKCTELGVDKIIPFESAFCTVKDKGNKIDRLNRIAVSASKQSGRVNLPQISRTLNFDEMLQELHNYSQIILAYEKDNTNAKNVLSQLDKNKNIAIIIGSEGGFSESEVEKIKSTGALLISLGENILRAETACVALLSAISYELDKWKRD